MRDIDLGYADVGEEGVRGLPVRQRVAVTAVVDAVHTIGGRTDHDDPGPDIVMLPVLMSGALGTVSAPLTGGADQLFCQAVWAWVTPSADRRRLRSTAKLSVGDEITG